MGYGIESENSGGAPHWWFIVWGHRVTIAACSARPSEAPPRDGTFRRWQPEYGKRGIATFPVQDKKPAVRNWQKIGLPYSIQLAQNCPNATAFGLVLGSGNEITVVDVDTTDVAVRDSALDRYGQTPFIVRSGSGHWQLWYRHNGEPRKIRPSRDEPIDILGGGFVVAPPSVTAKGRYEITKGTLDDLTKLPPARGIDLQQRQSSRHLHATETRVSQGSRAKELWEHCMRKAHFCDSFDDVLDIACTFNDRACEPPLPENEVVKAARSAWQYTKDGKNHFGQHGSWLPKDDVDQLVSDPYLLSLVTFLKANQRPENEFMVANGLAGRFKWSLDKLRGARGRAIDSGWLVATRPPNTNRPALYRWGPTRHCKAATGTQSAPKANRSRT